jgi:acetylornithine deacetylase
MELAAVRAEVEACIAQAAQTDPFLSAHPPVVSYHGFQAEGYALPRGTAAQAVLAQCHQAITGDALAEHAGTGTTDARFFGLYAGIPALVYGPRAQNIHAFDERVDLESMRRVTQTIALFIAQWCGTAARHGPAFA